MVPFVLVFTLLQNRGVSPLRNWSDRLPDRSCRGAQTERRQEEHRPDQL